MNPQLQSLVISQEKGKPLSWRVLIPPNLPTVAPRDKIMVKLEAIIEGEIVAPERMNRGHAYALEPAHFLAAMLIESWCEGKLFGLLQLSRDRLNQLLQPLQDQPAVFSLKNPQQPLPWKDGKLAGIHEHLVVTTEPEKEEAEESFADEAKEPEQPRRVAEADLTPMEVDGSTQYLSITLPSRESILYSEALELVKSHRFKLEPSNRKWWLRDRHQVLTFLSHYWTDLEEVYRARFSSNFKQRTAAIQRADVSFSADEKADGFDVYLNIKAKGIDSSELQSSLNKGQQYVVSGERIALVDQAKLKQVAQAQQKLSGDKERMLSPQFHQKLSHAELAGAEEVLEELNLAEEAPETWRARSQALKDLSHLKPAPIAHTLDQKLRPYQRIGTAWLWHLLKHDLGGILADEMGLGKTVQALALLQCVHTQQKVAGPSLIICPASLVENWRREAQTFSPELTVICHHGAKRIKQKEAFAEADLIVTSYGTLVRDKALFNEFYFATIIADEAQQIKNRRTQNFKALRQLQSKGRFLLTGTPIENSLEDLYSLFEFIMPGYLRKPPPGANREERNWYNQQIRDRVVPYILRRSKTLVAPELPDKIEKVFYCQMESKQKGFYEKSQRETEQTIFDMEMAQASEGKLRLAALNQLLRLRQICADPRILDQAFAAEESAKLQAFRELLDEAIDGGHRMLVFSQFVSILTLLREMLEAEGISYCYLDGKTKDRLGVCDTFNNDESIPVFLISLKAGGTGLNLTGADTVIHYDPWWNPAVEAQATDRAHRIGQSKVVTSIKLIVSNTVEEKVVHLQQTKAELLRDLLEASDAANAKIGLDDIKALLKS